MTQEEDYYKVLTTPVANAALQAASFLAPGSDIDFSPTRTRRLYTDPLSGLTWNRPLNRSPKPAQLSIPRLALAANAALGGLDYLQGKAEGEDDTRALTGAIGSTLGGFAGGTAASVGFGKTLQAIKGGASAGGSYGKLFGTKGRIAGALIGGLGGMAGAFLGGYGADRVDDFIRGVQ